MAEVVDIIGVTHSPGLPRGIRRGDERFVAVGAEFRELRERLERIQPDVLVMVGSDHLNQWFMNNMPAFLVGKQARASGPFPAEQEMFGMPSYATGVDRELAREMVAGGFDHGVDLAFSDECVIDHAFTVPLCLLRPEQDLPVVPLFTNSMAPPFPPASRFYQVGRALRSVIEAMPPGKRVAVVGSGHLSIEVGGPRMRPTSVRDGRPDPEFDEVVMDLLAKGDTDALAAYATVERMARAGNVTSGFLNFVLLAGLARGAPADRADCVGQAPFLAWNC